MTQTATMHIWLSKYHNIQHLARASAQELASAVALSTCGPNDNLYMEREGYTHIGTAIVEMTLNDRDVIVASKVEALRAEKRTTLAEAEKKATELERKIQELLAIGWDGIAPSDQEDQISF